MDVSKEPLTSDEISLPLTQTVCVVWDMSTGRIEFVRPLTGDAITPTEKVAEALACCTIEPLENISDENPAQQTALRHFMNRELPFLATAMHATIDVDRRIWWNETSLAWTMRPLPHR